MFAVICKIFFKNSYHFRIITNVDNFGNIVLKRGPRDDVLKRPENIL